MNGNPLPSVKILAAGAAVPLAPLAGWRPVRGGADLAAQLREERPDLLVLDAAGIGPELAALLMSAAFADMPLLLLAGDDDAEKVGLLLERPMRILPVPAEPGQLAALVAEAAAGLAGGGAQIGLGRLQILAEQIGHAEIGKHRRLVRLHVQRIAIFRPRFGGAAELVEKLKAEVRVI